MGAASPALLHTANKGKELGRGSYWKVGMWEGELLTNNQDCETFHKQKEGLNQNMMYNRTPRTEHLPPKLPKCLTTRLHFYGAGHRLTDNVLSPKSCWEILAEIC